MQYAPSHSDTLSSLGRQIRSTLFRFVLRQPKSVFWKVAALNALLRVLKGGKRVIDVDVLVDYLTRMQQQSSPREMHKGSLEHRALLMKALYGTIIQRIQEGVFSPAIVRKIVLDRWDSGFFDRTSKATQNYLHTYGRTPPGFVLLSPSRHCNLTCTGCYASSDSHTKEHLDYETVRRIVSESHEQWGARSVAISGGEPLMYRSGGKSILDLAEEFPYVYFKLYTNGTLITDAVAERMARLANVSPAISIEGTEQETDTRRGQGTYQKIIQAMTRLRAHGVPFGVSITATKNNMKTLLDPKFYDYLFDELKVTYGWIFQYMPIGRGATTALMPTPADRRRLFELLDIENKKGRFMCDFWSTSPSAEGCIAAGRSFGYLYINWDGAVAPCVFNPYSDVNILDVFAKGGTLTDAVENSPLFKSVRHWQDEYGFKRGQKAGNFMSPCPIRDHHGEYRKILKHVKPKPIDEAAAEALVDAEYEANMIAYGEQLQSEMEPVWRNRFGGS